MLTRFHHLRAWNALVLGLVAVNALVGLCVPVVPAPWFAALPWLVGLATVLRHVANAAALGVALLLFVRGRR